MDGNIEKKGSAKQQKSFQNKRWYVNVDEDMDAFKVGTTHFPLIKQTYGPYGAEMEVDVTLQTNNTKKEFEAKWIMNSDANNLNPALQGASPAKIRMETTKEQKQTQNNEEVRRFFRNFVDLPDIGGDKHKIICTKKNKRKSDRQILELDVETWRRLWFTIYWTDDAQAAVVNSAAEIIKASFEKAFIDIVHVPAQNKLNYQHNLFAIISSDKNDEDYIKMMHGGQHPALQRKPFHLQIVLVKKCAKLKEVDVKIKIDQTSFDKLVFTGESITGITVQIPNGDIVYDDDIVAQINKMRNNFHFNKMVRTVKYTIQGQPQATANPPYIAKRKGFTEFEFQLIGPLAPIARAIEAGNSVDFEFTVEVVDIGVAGQNRGNRIVVQTVKPDQNAFVSQTPTEVANTLIHEIGHALDLVSDGDFRWKHKNHYTGGGGVGRHCKLNAVLQNGIYDYGGSGKMCVMFHSLHPQAGPEFCEDCMKFLKFTKLRKANLGAYNKGWTFTS